MIGANMKNALPSHKLHPYSGFVAGIWLTVVAIATACHSYVPVLADVRVAEEVRVQFSAPRDLTGTLPSGGTIQLRSVKELEGRVLSIAGDSAAIAVSAATARGDVKIPIEPGATVSITRGPAVSIYARRLDEGKSAVVGVGAGLVVLYVVLLAATIALLAAWGFH
jgi:hypothetical protein